MKKKETKKVNNLVPITEISGSVRELMEVYEQFQESYAVTQRYLQMISPNTRQINSDRSFILEVQK